MKRIFLKSLLTAATVLWMQGAVAAGKVEVVGDTQHGRVTSSANGAVVTLTVTPADGYYIRKSDITATRTFMPTAAAPRRKAEDRSVPVADELTLVGADPDDLSLPRTYTVTLPGEEYDVLLDLSYTPRQRITSQMVSLSEAVFVYNELEQRPTTFVEGLREGTDYTVSYAEEASVETGTYTLTVSGRSTWQGTVVRTYQIFAGGKAEVNKNIAGGVIATAVDGLTVTLTVTPADGYYIRKEDVIVEKTFLPVAGQQKNVRRNTVPAGDRLTLEGADPDDLSLPRTYTAQIPGWEYSVLVDATFTLRKTVTANMLSLSATSFVYNGSDQRPTVAVRDLTEGKDYVLTFEGTSWADVGTYNLTVRGRSTWQGTVQRSFVITKAPSVVTVKPEAQNLTYNGLPQTLIAAGDAMGGTLLYSTDANDYQMVLPQATAAGRYTAYYKVQGDANHEDTKPQSLTVTIAKREVTISGITAEDKVYDGTTTATLDFDAVAFGGLVEGDALTVTAKGNFEDVHAGENKTVNIGQLTLGGASIANYQLTANGQQTTAKAAITKAESVVTKEPKALMLVYTGEAQLLTESGEATGGVLQYSFSADGPFATTVPAATVVGDYTVYYKVAGDRNHFDTKVASVRATITAKELNTPTIELSETSFVYDGTAKEPAVTVKDGATVIPASEYSVSYTSNTNAGEATVVVSDKDGGNYTVNGQTTFIITAKELNTPTIELSETSFVYDGTAKEPAVTVKDGATVIPASEYSVSYTSNTNAGEATVVVSDKDGGNYTVNGRTTFIITAKELGNPTIELSETSFVYDGTAKEPAVTVKDGTMVIPASEYRVSYTSNTNAGEATVAISDRDGGNYIVSGQTTFTIEKATAVVTTAPKALTLVYTGGAQALVSAGEATGGALQYSLSADGLFVEMVPVATEVGDYTVYYKVVGDENHFGTEVASVRATIAAKELNTPTIELSETSFVYDGTAKEPAVTVKDGATVVPVSEYNVSYLSNTNAGEATVVISDEDGGNYTVSGQVIFTIGKAFLNVIADNKTLELGQPLPELTVRCKGFVNNETEAVLDRLPVATTEATSESEEGVYEIAVAGAEARNYDFIYMSGTLTIYVPQVLQDEKGNEVEGSVLTNDDGDSHVLITTLTEEMLSGDADIPTELMDEDGQAYQVTQVAAEAFEEIDKGTIISLPEGLSTTGPVTNVINGDGTCEKLELTFVEEFEANKTLAIEEVVYEREVDEEVFTICLPYSIEVPEGAMVYTLSGNAEGGVKLTDYEGSTMEAYAPYVMKQKPMVAAAAGATATEQSLVLDLGAKNVVIAPTGDDVSNSKGDYVLCGTVRGLTHAQGRELGAYVLQPDASWKMTASEDEEDADKQYLAPFQVYLQYVGTQPVDIIGTQFDMETAISAPVMTKPSVDDGWFDLQGRKLNSQPTRKGIYIRQGRKIRL